MNLHVNNIFKLRENKNINQNDNYIKNKFLHFVIFFVLIISLVLIAVFLIIKVGKEQKQIVTDVYNVNIYNAKNILGRVAVISEFKGNVIVTRNEKEYLAFNNFRLEEGDNIKTGTDSYAKIEIDGNKSLKMDNNSIIKVEALLGNKTDNITTIVLSNGRLLNNVKEKLSSNSRYNIKTLNTIVGVKGTIFVVTCDVNEHKNYCTQVENLSGLVDVERIDVKNKKVLAKVTLKTKECAIAEEKINVPKTIEMKKIDTLNLDEFIKTEKEIMNRITTESNQITKNESTVKTTVSNQTVTTNTNNNFSPASEPIKNIIDTTKNVTEQINKITQTETNIITKPTESISKPTESTIKPVESTNVPTVILDNTKPSLSISGPDITSVKLGGQVEYSISYYDNVGIKEVVLTSGDVILNGFTAKVTISGTGIKRIVTLTNIQGTAGSNKYIKIATGTGIDTSGNVTDSKISAYFSILENKVITPTGTSSTTTYISPTNTNTTIPTTTNNTTTYTKPTTTTINTNTTTTYTRPTNTITSIY